MKEYTKGIYTTEVTREELKRYLARVLNHRAEAPSLEEIIIDLCLQDEEPEIVGTATDREDLDEKQPDYISVDVVQGSHNSFLRLSVMLTEINEDGDDYTGTSYDTKATCTEEDRAAFCEYAGVEL